MLQKSALIFIALCMLPSLVSAQELHNDTQGVYAAEVVEVLHEEDTTVPGTDVAVTIQTLRAEVLEGPLEGQVIEVENDYIPLEAGENFFLNHLRTINGDDIYSVREPDRRGVLLIFTLIFVLSFIALTGWKGVKSLLSLVLSFGLIFYFLLPRLLEGWNPVFASSIFAVGVLALVMYLTHGWNGRTHAAFLGTSIAIFVTVILARIAVSAAHLSGFISDEAVYLNLDASGTLSLSGLLLGGIIIGTIGVLDDIAITQSAVVHELKTLKESLSQKEIFARALRVGKEHLGALVNTLALAYAGSSLPLLLIFTISEESPWRLLNREIFATEIIRTLVGSMGLILAVPITTALALWLVKKGSGASHAHHHHH